VSITCGLAGTRSIRGTRTMRRDVKLGNMDAYYRLRVEDKLIQADASALVPEDNIVGQ